MNLTQPHYLPGLIIIFCVFAFIVLRFETQFFAFIKKHWFLKRSFINYISSFLFILGTGGLLVSLLDLRGPEERIKTEVPKDRTIILIDTSASMLAEDVKPSRLQKAALIGKHFARKAAGHQLSVVAFAEIQKKIVPFTNDLDLIDARLDSIKNLRNQNGSSALSLAIQESIQYLREAGGEARGNILVLTDGEETAEGISLNIPKGIHLALVGIGTEQGGRIPLDDGRGFRFGYKKDRGQDVITKLEENFFKQVTSDVPSGKYWLANSYTLPSEEILGFFKGEKNRESSQQEMVIKPVLMEWIVVPSICALVLSYVLKSIRIFTLVVLLFSISTHSQENEAPELSPDTVQKLQDLKEGKLSKAQRIKLADELFRAGAKEEGLSLYQENLPPDFDHQLPPEAYLNYGTALLQSGKIQEGLDVYRKLSTGLGNEASANNLRDMMDKNVLAAFRKQEQQKKQQKKQQENQKKQDSSESNDKESKGNKQSGSDKQNQSQSSQGKEQEKNEKKSDDKNNSPERDQPKTDQDPNETSEDKQSKKDQKPQETKNTPSPKLPAKLKQLMSDDRQLQLKMIENGTKDLNRRKSRKSKDW
jgi:Ca-activated chloride channel family protein